MASNEWILSDGERDLVRLDAPVRREMFWFEYRVTPLSVLRLHEYLAENPGAEGRLTARDAETGQPAEYVLLGIGDPPSPDRLLVRGLRSPR